MSPSNDNSEHWDAVKAEDVYPDYLEYFRVLQLERSRFHDQLAEQLEASDESCRRAFISVLTETRELPHQLDAGSFTEWWAKLSPDRRAAERSRFRAVSDTNRDSEIEEIYRVFRD